MQEVIVRTKFVICQQTSQSGASKDLFLYLYLSVCICVWLQARLSMFRLVTWGGGATLVGEVRKQPPVQSCPGFYCNLPPNHFYTFAQLLLPRISTYTQILIYTTITSDVVYTTTPRFKAPTNSLHFPTMVNQRVHPSVMNCTIVSLPQLLSFQSASLS